MPAPAVQLAQNAPFRAAPTNYLENYRCSACATTGLKLWRPVHGIDGWLCAACATAIERPRLEPTGRRECLWSFDEDGAFTFASSDQLGDMLPAVPDAEGTSVYGYTSVPSDRVRWWHSLATHADPALEIRSLRNILLRALAQRDSLAEYLQKVSR